MGVRKTPGTNFSERKLRSPSFPPAAQRLSRRDEAFVELEAREFRVFRGVRRAKRPRRPARSGRKRQWRTGPDLGCSGKFRRDSIRAAARFDESPRGIARGSPGMHGNNEQGNACSAAVPDWFPIMACAFRFFEHPLRSEKDVREKYEASSLQRTRDLAKFADASRILAGDRKPVWCASVVWNASIRWGTNDDRSG